MHERNGAFRTGADEIEQIGRRLGDPLHNESRLRIALADIAKHTRLLRRNIAKHVVEPPCGFIRREELRPGDKTSSERRLIRVARRG